MSRLSDAAESMRNTAANIDADVRNLSAELIHWRPAPEVWSIMDNLCHIVEFVPYWTNEVQAIVRDPTQTWGRDHTHAGRLAAVRDTSGKVLDEVLSAIRNVVSDSAETLAALPDQALATEAPSRNPRWGAKPVSFIVDHLLVQHLQNHRSQIQRNIRQHSEYQAPAVAKANDWRVLKQVTLRHLSVLPIPKQAMAGPRWSPRVSTEIDYEGELAVVGRAGRYIPQQWALQYVAPVADLMAYCSLLHPLSPGDVIVSGTPGGVGVRRTPQLFMKAGDVVEVEISSIGTLRNQLVQEEW
jgi:uncharacterized damage-inducible protein DinB